MKTKAPFSNAKAPMPDKADSDLVTLARQASDGGLDLMTVAFRVRTDLLVGSARPNDVDLKTYTEFALAVLPKLKERDLGIIGTKLAAWPHTPDVLMNALRERLPELTAPKRQITASVPAAMQGRVTITAVRHEVEPVGMDVEGLRGALLQTSNTSAEAGIAAQPETPEVADADTAPAHATHYATHAETTAAIDEALAALRHGDTGPALLLLQQADNGPAQLGPADIAPFFLLASPVQQSLILGGLAQLERLQPPRFRPRVDAEILGGLIESASTDRAGAFIGLAAQIGGTPEYAAAMTLDASRKLAGITLIALDASVEDAVRFAIKLGDESSRSVSVIYGLVDTLRQIRPAIAMRLALAIGGSEIKPVRDTSVRHIPAADPSGTPSREGSLREPVRAERVSPLQIARKLTGQGS
jgi:hypothetical protein